jgi:hypothetical protein
MSAVTCKHAKTGFWNAKVREYYVKKLGVSPAILKLMEKRIVRDIAGPRRGHAKSLRGTRLWKPLLADFGEAAASWFLETNEALFLVKLRWVEFPLKVGQGIDIMGFRKSTEDIAVSEAKTVSSRKISSTIGELGDQLCRQKIEKDLDLPLLAYGSKGWLVDKLVQKGIIAEEKAEEILDKTQYLRYGFVFHPETDKPPSYADAVKRLQSEGLPIRFIDYSVEDIDHEIKSLVEVLAVPKGLVK